MQGLFILLNIKPHLQTMEMLEEFLKNKRSLQERFYNQDCQAPKRPR